MALNLLMDVIFSAIIHFLVSSNFYIFQNIFPDFRWRLDFIRMDNVLSQHFLLSFCFWKIRISNFKRNMFGTTSVSVIVLSESFNIIVSLDSFSTICCEVFSFVVKFVSVWLDFGSYFTVFLVTIPESLKNKKNSIHENLNLSFNNNLKTFANHHYILSICI